MITPQELELLTTNNTGEGRWSVPNEATPKFKIKVYSPNLIWRDREKCVGEFVGIASIIIFCLSKSYKSQISLAYFNCDVIFLVRLQGKIEIDHSWERKA